MELALLYQHRDNIVTYARQRLTNAQQRVFVEHFMMSLIEDSSGFPIDGDKAMTWLGYATKHRFKAFVERTLKLDEDYKIFFSPRGEKNDITMNGNEITHSIQQVITTTINSSNTQDAPTFDTVFFTRTGKNSDNTKDPRGRLMETIMLSLNGFKTLEMMCKTQHGAEVRSYYMLLEKLLIDYAFQQINAQAAQAKEQAAQAKEKINELETALTIANSKVAGSGSRVCTSKPKQSIYAYMLDQNKYKIGKGKSWHSREDSAKTWAPDGAVVYTQQFYNKDLAEKVIHHLLDQHRRFSNHEVFDTSLDTIKAVFNSVHLFLDGLVHHVDGMVATGFEEKLKSIVEQAREASKANGQKSPPQGGQEDESVEDDESELDEDDGEDSIIKQAEEHVLGMTSSMSMALDFPRFIQECCILGEKNIALSAELSGAHRLWGRSCTQETKNAFFAFLKANYKKTKVYEPKTKATLTGYRGISLKPIEWKKSQPPSDIDMFIEEKCNVNYSARISTRQAMSAFEAWKRDHGNSAYTMDATERGRVAEELGKRFVPSNVFTGNHSEFGIIGLELKEAPSTVGLKVATKLRKPVVKIDMKTNTIVERFESLVEASRETKRGPGCLSADIKYKRPHGGYLYQFVDRKSIEVKERPDTSSGVSVAEPKRAAEEKPKSKNYYTKVTRDKRCQKVEQVDAQTGAIIEVFDSQSVVAKKIGKSLSTVSNLVREKKVIDGCYYRQVA